MKRFRHTIRRSSLLALVAAVAASGCSGKRKPANGLATPIVRLVHPELRSISRSVEQPSFVESYERSSVYPKMTAYIKKWHVDIGDSVKKGDTLAILFVPELREQFATKKAAVTVIEKRIQFTKDSFKVAQADVKAATARIAETKATLMQYSADVERWDVQVGRLKRERDKGVVDPQIVLETENQLKSSKAAQDAAKASIARAEAELIAKESALAQAGSAIDIAQADLTVAISEEKRLEALVSYLTLQAPFDGIVTVRNANTMDFVLPSTGDPTAMARSSNLSPSGTAAPIFVVERTDIVRVFVDIPEIDANYVRVGSKASVQVRAFRDEPIPATVTRTSWALNVKSRALRVEIDLPNIESKILPGMYAYATVVIERPRVWAIPIAALDFAGNKTFCWRYENNRAMRMEIRTGLADEKWIEVIAFRGTGSDERSCWMVPDGSEEVILSDVSLLADGEPVQVG